MSDGLQQPLLVGTVDMSGGQQPIVVLYRKSEQPDLPKRLIRTRISSAQSLSVGELRQLLSDDGVDPARLLSLRCFDPLFDGWEEVLTEPAIDLSRCRTVNGTLLLELLLELQPAPPVPMELLTGPDRTPPRSDSRDSIHSHGHHTAWAHQQYMRLQEHYLGHPHQPHIHDRQVSMDQQGRHQREISCDGRHASISSMERDRMSSQGGDTPRGGGGGGGGYPGRGSVFGTGGVDGDAARVSTPMPANAHRQ